MAAQGAWDRSWPPRCTRSGEFSISALVDAREPSELFGATYAASWDDVDASRVDVVIDFSSPEGVVASAQWCAANGKGLVIGTTGLNERATKRGRGRRDQGRRRHRGELLGRRGVVGEVRRPGRAVLRARRDHRTASRQKGRRAVGNLDRRGQGHRRGAGVRPGWRRWNDPTVRHTVSGARGADTIGGIKIHSVRLPGLTAHQEILFGGPGEGLTIRHDSFDRLSFVQGVALAANAVDATPRLIDGIDSLI
jgi:4-hydroxy-tetrahydrodipicolinate reductase